LLLYYSIKSKKQKTKNQKPKTERKKTMTRNQWKAKKNQWRRNELRAINHHLASCIEGGRVQAVGFALLAQIEEEVEPLLLPLRTAQDYMDAGYKSQLDNSPELYGKSLQETMAHYIPRGGQHRLHHPGSDCDCELDEVESNLVRVISYGYAKDVEDPLIP
jgi:hypothetical protein